jgi:AcrR family transcriptional regulator
MSEAGLLYHFPTKEALLIGVLERRDEISGDKIPDPDIDPAGVLRAIVSLVAASARQPGVVELFCRLSAEATSPTHAANAYFNQRYVDLRYILASSFRQLRAKGRAREDLDPVRAAVQTIAFIDGVQLQWLLDRDSVDMVDSLSSHMRLLVPSWEHR